MVARGLGLEFRERLSGSYRDDSAVERPLWLDLCARSAQRDGRPIGFDASGTLSAEGLAEGAPVSGRIWVVTPGDERHAGPGPSAWSLRYEVEFRGLDGRSLRIVADKRDLVADPYAAFTTLRGSITDVERARTIARLSVRFDARGDLRWWLSNLRIVSRAARATTAG